MYFHKEESILKNESILTYNNFSNILLNNSNKVIGLQLFITFVLPDLNNGMTMTRFKPSEEVTSIMHKLSNSLVNSQTGSD